MITCNESRRPVRKTISLVFLVTALLLALFTTFWVGKARTLSHASSERQSTLMITNGEGNNRDSIEDKVKPEREIESSHVPFILRLSQSAAEKVTAILDSTKSVQMRSGFVTLRPGENVGSHNTGQHEELLIILKGKGRVEAQQLGTKNISEGMVVYIPPNDQHNVYCAGASPLLYIYVVSRTR
jgi:quercetin dioxygenase-like cupin family protein